MSAEKAMQGYIATLRFARDAMTLIRGFTPDTPKNSKNEKLKFSFFAVSEKTERVSTSDDPTIKIKNLLSLITIFLC